MEHLLQLTANSEIFVLTGAGISKESGIQTFRDQDGLWNNHRVEDVATPEAFYRNPALVYEFYNKRRKELNSGIKPNRAHNILSELWLCYIYLHHTNKLYVHIQSKDVFISFIIRLQLRQLVQAFLYLIFDVLKQFI